MADACNLSVAGWTKLGLQQRLNVLIVASRETAELKRVRAQFPSARLAVFSGVDSTTIRRFSHDDLIGGVRIGNGRILAQKMGGTPNALFFNPPQRR